MSLDLLPVRPTGMPDAAPSSSTSRSLGAALRDSRLAALGAVGLLLLVSLWLRSRALHFHYWIDEGLSVGIAGHPISEIPHLLRQDGSPPLYYLLLHVWIGLRGSAEVATHELSLILALLTVVAAYWAGSSLFDRRTGVTCTVLAAGVPFLTDYGQETRMYALLALLSVLIAASFLHVFVARRRRYIPVLVMSTAAALYTHNWVLFLALMGGVAFLVLLRTAAPADRRGLWRDAAICSLAVALLYAPWVPTVVYQATHTGAPWDGPPALWSLTQGSYSLVGGRGAAVALLFGAVVGLAALAGPRAVDKRTQRLIWSLLLLGFGTMVTAWVYSHLTPAWAPRYLAVIIGPLVLLFGLGLARSGTLGLLALGLVCAFWVLDPIPSSLDSKSNVASAVAHIRPKLRPGTVVLSTQPEQVPTLAYYLHDGGYEYVTPLGRVPDPGVVDWRNALARFRRSSVPSVLSPVLSSMVPGQRVWLVLPTQVPETPDWMQLINRTNDEWSRTLLDNPAFARIGGTRVSPYAPGLTVRSMLFERRGTPTDGGR